MGKIIDGDDGLPAEEVGYWVEDKHNCLCRYVDISRGPRSGWIGPGKAGATYIDLFCGAGRCRIKETGKWIDGGAVAAWKKSVEGGAPFTQVLVGDLDEQRRSAAVERLRRLGAPVKEFAGPAVDVAKQVVSFVNPHGLHFTFLDPYNLEALNFQILQSLSKLRRIDILIHLSQMDLQRNLVANAVSEESAFDSLAPGWRDKVDIVRGQQEVRQQVFEYWRGLVASLGVDTSTEMRLIRGSKNQPLYWLLLAAKHDLAHRFWATAANVEGQGKFDF